MEGGESSFYTGVYEIVGMIPYGKVATYGQIAELLGRPASARHVGFALSRSPVGHTMPCHRVVRSDGSLAPRYVFGGQESQRARLEAEGVAFRIDGRINMARCQWAPILTARPSVRPLDDNP